MTGEMRINGVAMPPCVPTGGLAQQWLSAMPPARLQELAASGPVNQRALVVEAVADYEGFEHAAFRAVVDGGTKAAPFLAAMASRQGMADVITNLGVRADAIHIANPTYVARAAQLARSVQGMTDGEQLHATIQDVHHMACRLWHGLTFGGVDLSGLGLRPLNSVAYAPRAPLSAEESVRLVMEGDERRAGHCVEIGIRTTLLASAMAAFCPLLSTEWVDINHVIIDGSGPAAHVFATVNTPTQRFALDSQGINWKYQKTNPYHRTMGRIGALAGWYNNLGIAKKSVTALETAVMLWPNNAAMQQALALAYLQSKRFDDAARAAEIAVTLEPSHAPHHLTFAFIRGAQRRGDDALRHIDATMRLAPRDPHLLTMCGELLKMLSCWQKSAEAFVAALAANPEFDPARQHLAQLMRAHRDVRVRVPSRPGGGGLLGGLANAAFHTSTWGMFLDDDD